jgi:hypothetical protein
MTQQNIAGQKIVAFNLNVAVGAIWHLKAWNIFMIKNYKLSADN